MFHCPTLGAPRKGIFPSMGYSQEKRAGNWMLWLNCFGILWEILPQAIILFSQCLPALYRLIHILQIESLLECFSIKLVISALVQCAMCVTFLLGQKAVINDRPQKVLIVPIWWTNQRGKSLIKASHSSCPNPKETQWDGVEKSWDISFCILRIKKC